MFCCKHSELKRELNWMKDGFRIFPIIYHRSGGCGHHRGVRDEDERGTRCGAVGEHFNFTKFQMCVTLAEDRGGNLEADQYQQVTDQSVTHNEHSRM